MNNLKYNRQFLFTPIKSKEFENWNIEELGTHYIYTHPKSVLTRINKNNIDIILIGHVVNPHNINDTVYDILEKFLNYKAIDDITEVLYGLTGRFVLLIKNDNKYTFFNDACGLKMLFYTQKDGQLYAASQPLLLEAVTEIKKSKNHKLYFNSNYVNKTVEHWIPSGISLFDEVYQLVPNHYLDVDTLKQIRYWPNRELIEEDFESSVEKLATILKNTMLIADKNFKLALPLTAGWDSRIILSSSKSIYKNLWMYTLKYRDLENESNDIKIPRKLSNYLGFEYNIINCTKPLDEKFIDIYSSNTDMPHVNDWGKIAYGMYDEYPNDRLAVKGNCSEVGRCFYYPSGKHNPINSSHEFLKFESGWEDIDFIKERVSEWFEEVKPKSVNLGYDLLDLFYWEHRMGSWQAQSQLEWDIVQEAFTPFNNRELLDIMLKVNPLYRVDQNNLLYQESMKKLWEEVLSEPINPLTTGEKIKSLIKVLLLKLGIFDFLGELKSRINQ